MTGRVGTDRAEGHGRTLAMRPGVKESMGGSRGVECQCAAVDLNREERGPGPGPGEPQPPPHHVSV